MLLRVAVVTMVALGAGSAEGASAQERKRGASVSEREYEGWRQYSVHCARCHGQDVLGNPVAADLLKSTAPGGPVAEEAAFVQVVREGRPDKGMPPLEGSMTPEQMGAVYAYVRGRAEGKIPAGRPAGPGG